MKPYPPLGLLYLSAWLDKFGLENEVFDTTFSSFDLLKKQLLLEKAPIVALYANLMTKVRLLDIIRFIRQEPSLSNSLIVLGGPDVTYNCADYLANGADVLVIGEGEQSMLELALAYKSDMSRAARIKQFSQISGLAFLLEDGTEHKTTPREKIRQLDDLPFPNRHKIDLELYLKSWKKTHGESAISLSTQRGCPYTCKWCSTAVYGQSYRRRSPVNVVDEIVQLQQQYEFDHIWFVDDVFTVSHNWIADFHKELTERQVSIKFECITRADRLNEAVLNQLRACGCSRIWIGAESGSQRIIDAMDRRVTVDQVRSMIQIARDEGIETGTFIMLGYPGEKEEDIRETVHHLKVANPDLFTITLTYPIKGTALYEEVEPSIIEEKPWQVSSDRDRDFKRTYSKRYYGFAIRWVVNSVNLHKQKSSGKAFTINQLLLQIKIQTARLGMIFSRL